MALAVATKVSDGQMTVSPGPAPSARCARCSSALQLVTAKSCLTPTIAANCRSNSAVTGPIESHLERSTSVTAQISSSPRSMSANGTFQRLTIACPLVRQSSLRLPLPLVQVQISLDVFVLFEGFFVVTMVADIEPITIKGIAHYGPAIGQETFHKVREVQVFVRLNILQHLMLEDVDAHADLECMYGFFDVISNITVVCIVDDSEVNLKILFIRSNSHKSLVLLVKLEEVAIVKVGDHVAIHDQKALLKVVHLGQGANRPKGLILKAIRNV